MDVPARTLNDGTTIPWIGFGTFPLRGNAGYTAVLAALENGYRLLDAAVNYRNEVEVGRAVRDFVQASGVDRDEITVQTKIPGHLHDHDHAIQACQDSLELLGLERIDVLLIHSPNPMDGTYRDAWRTLVELRESGLVRSIGVSNFPAQYLAAIIEDTGVTPAINQVELHPYTEHRELLAEHARLGIATQAWSPLGVAESPYSEPAVTEAAAAHGVTPAQAVLRWHLQLGNVPLPMSQAAAEQRGYLDVFGFGLSEAEVAAISALARPGARLFGNPG